MSFFFIRGIILFSKNLVRKEFFSKFNLITENTNQKTINK